MPKGHFNSSLKVRKLVSKVCIYHLVRLNDSSDDVSSPKSFSLVKKFQDVFPNDLPGVSLEREIEFSIDIIQDTCPISIYPYRVAPTELNWLERTTE